MLIGGAGRVGYIGVLRMSSAAASGRNGARHVARTLRTGSGPSEAPSVVFPGSCLCERGVLRGESAQSVHFSPAHVR